MNTARAIRTGPIDLVAEETTLIRRAEVLDRRLGVLNAREDQLDAEQARIASLQDPSERAQAEARLATARELLRDAFAELEAAYTLNDAGFAVIAELAEEFGLDLDDLTDEADQEAQA